MIASIMVLNDCSRWNQIISLLELYLFNIYFIASSVTFQHNGYNLTIQTPCDYDVIIDKFPNCMLIYVLQEVRAIFTQQGCTFNQKILDIRTNNYKKYTSHLKHVY